MPSQNKPGVSYDPTANPSLYRPEIHPTAVIHPSAQLPSGMAIGPLCVIGEHVKFTGPCRLHERVSVHGRTEIGPGNEFFQGAVIGTIPQDLKYCGELTELKIGTSNIFREYVTVHLGTVGGGGVTSIGDHNLLMAYAHIAHDCHIQNHIVLANNVGLSGHVTIEDWVVVGGMTGVIQFGRIGRHAHVGGQLRITKDVAPYCRVAGEDRVHIIGANSIGLERRGFSKEAIETLKAAIRTLVSPKHTTASALEELAQTASCDEVRILIEFVRASRIGIHK